MPEKPEKEQEMRTQERTPAERDAHVALISLHGITKLYHDLEVLSEVSLEVRAGEFLALTGPSGSGKSTLLGILGLLERPSSGEYLLRGQEVSRLSDAEQSKLRNRTFGFVFQQFHLLPELTALDNVARPLVYAGVRPHERRERAMRLLERFGLQARATHRPAQLSGGEQQRVAIARALVNDPQIILADEPTGNLPQALWQNILSILDGLHKEGRTVVVVSHDPLVAARAHRHVRLKDGRVEEMLDL